MTGKEKLLLLKGILDNHCKYFDFLSDDEVKDYIECIQMYLKSDNRIIQEAGLSTCQLIIQKI
ncbi:hypothetical protein ACFFK0_22825 [Paenibacillus chartarius]|uniref:Uncharacterized protein n=1 Tax=Paenibacillus chartarius TaxID=747481 RepID=A0ABV6DRG9_9BACL